MKNELSSPVNIQVSFPIFKERYSKCQMFSNFYQQVGYFFFILKLVLLILNKDKILQNAHHARQLTR